LPSGRAWCTNSATDRPYTDRVVPAAMRPFEESRPGGLIEEVASIVC
jgi:hypothetical protein